MRDIIKPFCDKYELEYHENYMLKIINNIPEYMLINDSEYYYEIKEQIDNVSGLFYVDPNNQLIILVKKQGEVDLFATILHEYVHLCDYKNLAIIRNNPNIRELQNDYVFLFWTEFHATYLVNKYLLDMNKKGINVISVQNEIVDKLIAYISSAPQLEINEVVDKTVRSYGSYWALYDEFCDEVTLYPKGYYVNKDFLEIYNFLGNHKNFDDFIIGYNDFYNLLHRIQQQVNNDVKK